MTITETNVETLKTRVANGLKLCNDLQQRIALSEHPEEYQPMRDQHDKYLKHLNELSLMLEYQGFTGCVFGACRYSDEWICFTCTKREG